MDPQTVVALASMLIAIAALFVATWQTASIHKHNRLSVKPHLSIGLYFVPDHELTVFLENSGAGPAFVESFQVELNGKLYQGSIIQQLSLCFSHLGFPNTYVFSIPTVSHGAMKASEKLALVRFPETDTDMDLRRYIRGELIGVSITIKYKSIYEELFVCKRTLHLV